METKYKFTKKDNITVLTGAGISAESGVKTFRGNNGLWENHRIEEVATPSAFKKNPEMVWKFYKQRINQLKAIKPNPAHDSLKKLEDFLEQDLFLITQNVDGLHHDAGNKRVLEMHGNLRTCRCTECNLQYAVNQVNLEKNIPRCCECNEYLRPNVVWFGEMPKFLSQINSYLSQANYFIIIGTSGIVYPAAQFLPIAKRNGAVTIGINLEKPANLSFIDEFHQGKAGKLLPELVKIWTDND